MRRGRRESLRGVAQAENEGGNSFLGGVAAVASGMQHEVLGADVDRAFQLAAEALDRLGADHRIEGRQIHQIVDVDDQRVEVVLLAGGAQSPDLLRVDAAGAPHAGAGGEDLEGVRAELRRGEGRGLERPARKGVNAESQRLHRIRALEQTKRPKAAVCSRGARGSCSSSQTTGYWRRQSGQMYLP